MLWIHRGVMVGASLGSAAGSVLPFVGTIFGGVAGLLVGTAIGLAVAVFAAVTRRWFPTSPKSTTRRERVWCIVAIWLIAAIVEAQTALGPWVIAPALLGTLHAIFAGPPEPDAVYCGKPSTFSRAVCCGLPFAIVVVTMCGWVAAMFLIGNG